MSFSRPSGRVPLSLSVGGVLTIHLPSRAGQGRIDQSSFLDWVSSSIGRSQRREPLFSMTLECEWQAKTYWLPSAVWFCSESLWEAVLPSCRIRFWGLCQEVLLTRVSVSWLSIFSLSLLPTIGDHGSHNFVFIIIFSCVVVIYNWVVICDEVGVLGCLVLSFGIRNLLTLQHRFCLWGSLLRLHCVWVESTTVFKGQHRTITLPMKKELIPSMASYGSHQKMRWDRFGAVYTKGRKDPPCSKGDGLLGSSRRVVKTVSGK